MSLLSCTVGTMGSRFWMDSAHIYCERTSLIVSFRKCNTKLLERETYNNNSNTFLKVLSKLLKRWSNIKILKLSKHFHTLL